MINEHFQNNDDMKSDGLTIRYSSQNIHVSHNSRYISYAIYNTAGMRITSSRRIQANTINIGLASLNRGVYFIHLLTDNASVMERFVLIK